jgi:type II secretory pathway component PulF
MASTLLADETVSEVSSLQQGEAYIRTLEYSQHDYQRAALREQVRAAERAGNLSEALRLADELNQLAKS